MNSKRPHSSLIVHRSSFIARFSSFSIQHSAFIILDLLLLLAAVWVFYPKLALPDRISPGGDMFNLMLPAREFAAHWLSRGTIPLWNPQTFGGAPFHGAMQAAVFYPPNFLLGPFLSPLATINVLRFVHIFLFGALTWLFLRTELKCARPAALLGAIAVAGSAHVSSHTDHVNQLAAVAWLPGLVLFQWRFWRTGGLGALAGFAAVLALQVLAGHPQAVFYSLMLNGAIAAAWFLRGAGEAGGRTKGEGRRTKDEGQRAKGEGRRTKDEGQRAKDEGQRAKDEGQRAKDEGRRTKDEGLRTWDKERWAEESDRRAVEASRLGERPFSGIERMLHRRFVPLFLLGVAVTCGLLLAAVQMVPTAETSRYSRRAIDGIDYPLWLSMPPRYIQAVVAPRAWGDPLSPGGYADPLFASEFGSFVGRTTLVFALVGLGAGVARRRFGALFWAMVVAAAFVLALGGFGPLCGKVSPLAPSAPFPAGVEPSPVFRAYLWLFPPARHLRVPPRILLLAIFGLAVLGAMGLNFVLTHRRLTGRASRRLLASVVGWAAVALAGYELWDFQRGEFHNRVVPYYAPRELLRGVVDEPLRARLESAADSLPQHRLFRLMVRDPDYLMDPRAAAVRNRCVRLQPNLGLMLGFDEIEGYEEGLLPPLRYFDFLNAYNRNLRNPDPDPVLLGIMNVRHLCVEHGLPVGSPTWKPIGEIVEPDTGQRYRFFENPLWLPRVIRTDWVKDEIALGELRGTYSRGGRPSPRVVDHVQRFTPYHDSIVDRGYIVEPEKTATMSIDRIEPNRIELENREERGGEILVVQNPYPGWIVEAAGAEAPLRPKTDFAGAAVIPPGARRITIAYRPFSFRLGAYLSGAGLMAWVAFAVGAVGRGPTRKGRFNMERSAPAVQDRQG